MRSISEAIDLLIESAMQKHGWQPMEAAVFLTYALKEAYPLIIKEAIPPF